MARWIKLDPEEWNPPTREKIRGVEVTVSLSAYDVPEAVCGQFDEDIQRFVINFHYIVDEPTRRTKDDPLVTLRIGRHSGRIYGMEIDTDHLKGRVNLAHVAAEEAIKTLESDPRWKRRWSNYRLVRKILQEKGRELWGSLWSRGGRWRGLPR